MLFFLIKYSPFLASIEGRYARTLYETAHDDKEREDLLLETKAFWNMIQSHDDLKKTLLTPLVHRSLQLKVAVAILKAKKFSNLFTHFIMLLTEKGRLKELNQIFKNFEKIHHFANNVIDVQVVTAKAMTKGDEVNFKSFLKKNFEGNLNILFSVNESLIAGYRVHFPTKVLDASLIRQLHLVQQHILEGDL